ncbi:MAG: 3-hydroxyacyl-[acyl-carrier-protein] dehydratase [uncultured Aureispira sp.]|uniref:3-hydroxyacyl-[acyl-carrier-protein] dehydratase n=1 Tax=uncultured Aureispira sp. TaxID=1331704 RepID=A0A6S6TI51_9BACT|nr:MAG: 3-hydroxyacyl-[acyl-carrier-protein] dehydratase [uncultured Aureispira sp.]
MLQGDFFTTKQQEIIENTIHSQISLNVEHPIYKGHFPQQPVVPGVCMMQIVAELSTAALGKKVSLKKANQAKFLIPIIPQKNPLLDVKIKYTSNEDGSLKISASIQDSTVIFFKFKGTLA